MTHAGPKKGTRLSAILSFEAALVFPLILMLIFTFIGGIQGEQDAMILSHALDQTAREAALLLPLADLLEKYVDPKSFIEEVIPDTTLAGIALDGLADIGATVLASPFLLERVDRWARATAQSQGGKAPIGARRLAIDVDGSSQTIWLCLSFEQTTLFTRGWTEVKSRIPIWNAHLFKEEEDESQQDRDGIWLLPNFERGQAIRKIFGGHLPQFYPVIASWDGRQAVSIKSMDLTAPSWSSPSAVSQRISKLVQDLAVFEGAGGEGPQAGQIRSKKLILVIPDNEIGWKTQGLVNQWVRDARNQGVTLEVREYGTSHAHRVDG